MNDREKSREQLLAELVELRQRVANQDAQLARSQKAEADQQQLNNRLPVLVATAGLDGYYKEVNAAFEHNLGWSEQESLSRPFLEFSHPEDRAAAVETFARVRSGDSAIGFLNRNICKDGSHRWINWTVIPVPDRDIVFGIGQDITEQKRAEDELRRSEARWHSVVDNAPVQVTTVDHAGTILFINRPAPGLTLENVIGTSVFEYLQPEHCDQARQCIEHVFRTGGTVVNESMATGPHGTRSWYETRLGPVKVDERVVAVTLISSDITERKQAETALRESEERFRRIFDEGPLGVVLARLDGRIHHVNQRFCDLLSYSEREIIALGIKGFSHPDDHQLDEQLSARLLRGEIPSYTLDKRLFRKDGQVIWGQLTVSLLHDAEGKATHAIGMTEDITERKRAEEALLESEDRYRLLTEAIPHPVFRCDAEGGLIECNRRWYEYTGQTPAEARGNGWMKALHPDDVAGIAQRVREVASGGDVYQAEYRLRRASDGSYRWHLANAIPRRDASGTITGWFGTATDIDDRKRAEEELARNKAILQAAVESLPFEFFAIGPDGRYILQNAILREHYGDAIGKRPEDYASDEYTRQLWLDNNRRAFAGERVEGEIEAHIGDETRHYYNVITPIQDDGEICGILGVNVDITGRKRAENELQQANDRLEQRVLERTAELTKANERLQTEAAQRQQAEDALRQNEAKYRALVESSPDAVVMVDLQGRIVFASQRAAEQHGVLDPAELLGSQATDFVIESERDRFRASIGRLIEEEVHRNVEYTLLRRGGTTFDAEVSSAVISDAAGKPEAFMAVYRDISERKQADEVMRQTLDQLAAIYDGMIEGLLITDIETKRFVRVNAPFCRMLGYSEEELLAKAIKDIHPAEEVPNDERRFQAAAEGRVSINEERPVLRKDGSIFYADITGHRIFYDERPCLLALFRDVTERRQGEAKLKAEQNALRRMLLASDHERQLITYELHDGVAQQLLGAMIYLQSQELPKARKSTAAETAYREGMEALRRAASEIRRVMNRLRTPVLDKYGLAEALEDVAAQLRLTPEAPKIEYRHAVKFKRLEPTLENSLFRIAQEAMTNACRHSKSDQVHVKLAQKGRDVTLEVRDWGIGFAQETVQENRFGLEGIRARCRILGGRLSIKSEPGKGTVIQVKFPVIEATDED